MSGFDSEEDPEMSHVLTLLDIGDVHFRALMLAIEQHPALKKMDVEQKQRLKSALAGRCKAHLDYLYENKEYAP